MAQFVRPRQYGLPESSSTQKLTPLDMNMPRVYGARWILCFPLETDADYDELYVPGYRPHSSRINLLTCYHRYEKLRIGLAHTIRSIPWIAGVIVSATTLLSSLLPPPG